MGVYGVEESILILSPLSCASHGLSHAACWTCFTSMSRLPVCALDRRTGCVTWHEAHWDDLESRFLAFTLHDPSGGGSDLYAAFNAHGSPVGAASCVPPHYTALGCISLHQ